MFYNGIFNTPDEAARNAVQLADNDHEPLYFTVFPKAEDMIVEVGVAIYEYFGGWSNSSKKFQNFVKQYGNEGAIVSAHSRGTLTVSNGVNNFKKHGVYGVAKKTDFYLFGAAAHNQSIANTVDEISYGKKNYVYTQGHLLDPISTVVGYNWPTAYGIPFRLYYLYPPAIPPAIVVREGGGALAGFNPSTHRCYGDASPECKDNYGSFDFKKVHSTRTGS
ncbi:hypothetical protein [Bartonella harrusi]|uniref:Filamentous hemagglutinin n=1 Tax=Bartonella harrusi TaxID=2961895 RepID=A0ABY5EWW3_9HYPH|nr:hypothetical protein [Bartonella harrusi]UTO29361.1 hypothetical protein NMK50_03265 [Bartonella harrusi]